MDCTTTIWPCCHLFHVFLCCVRSSMLLHADLHSPALHFLPIHLAHSWPWRRLSSSNNQAGPQTGQTLLPWSSRLWFYYLPCPFPLGSWTPPYQGHCLQGCLWTHTPNQFFVCKYEAQQSTCPCSFPDHLCLGVFFTSEASCMTCAQLGCPSRGHWRGYSSQWGAGHANIRLLPLI